MLSSLTEEVIVVIFGLSITCNVRLALESMFNHHSKARALRLKDDLQLMKCDTKPVIEYARTFKKICDQLHAIGKPVKEIDKVHWFLHGLDTNFSTFSTDQITLLLNMFI